MHFSSIFKMLGIIILVLGVSQFVPLGYDLLFYPQNVWPLVWSLLTALGVGGSLALLPKSKHQFRTKDGFALVSFGWVAAGVFGALPYWYAGAIPSFTDAFFEAVSGFTTTGSSILADIEAVPRGLLLWRSFTQWLGGMGIIVLALAIVPYLNFGGGMSLFQAEVPGPTAEKLTPKIQDTAKVLWYVYSLITVLQIAALWGVGYSWFDSINHSMTTVSTGGFSTNNKSVAGFHNAWGEWIIIFFMVISGMNFALHYQYLHKKFLFKVYRQDSELRFYLLVIFFAVATIFTVIWFKQGKHDMDTFRGVVFSVTTIITTTGFATDDFEFWPLYGQLMLLLLMVIGGSAGSTAGGMKTVRILLVIKYMHSEMLKLLHPNLVRTVKLQKTQVPRNVLAGIMGFTFIYSAVMIVSIMLVSLEIEDMTTAISAVLACLGNIGPGLGNVGPYDNFSGLGDFTKWVLSFNMLMGRLEILTMLVLLLPQTWQKG